MRFALALALLCLSVSCAGGPDAGRDGDDGTWRYDVEVLEGGARLRVTGTLEPPHEAELSVTGGAEPFVSGVELLEGESWRPIRSSGTSWLIPRTQGNGAVAERAVVRWEFDVAGAARRFRRVGSAAEHRGAWMAPPSTWLLRPLGAPGDVRVQLRVSRPEGVEFVTGIERAEESDAWSFAARHIGQLPYTAFGKMRVERADVGGAAIEVALLEGRVGADPDRLLDWVVRSARLVADYYGRFPAPGAAVIVAPGRRGIGRAMGNGGASVFFPLGRRFRERSMRTDWVLMHELTHLGVPQLSNDHHWFEEGVATYVEPLIRVRAGIIDEQKYWRELMEGMPNGLPRDGDRGLDVTHTWGRIYWGGALFCFLADLEIRRRTNGERSFDDAMRGIVARGGSIARWQRMERVMKTADGGAGVPVFLPLYEKMARSPHPVDLGAIWRALGVSLDGDRVSFDDEAPDRAIRMAMTSG